MRYALLALFLIVGGSVSAQERVLRGVQAQTDSRSGPSAAQCRIDEIVWARGGAGFVCDMGTDGRVMMVTDGGTQPGGISAFMSWLLEAQNMPSARDYITVNYEAADALSQGICDGSGLRGNSNRSSITCYRILSIVD